MTREYSEVVDKMCNISKFYTQDRDEAIKNLDEAVKEKNAAEKKAETAEAQKQKALDELRRIGVSEERIAEIMNS